MLMRLPFIRRWRYPLLSLLVAIALCLSQPLVARAISWGDLIFRGIQVLQLSTLSDQQEVALGQQINQQLVTSQVRILRNSGLTQYVNRVGQRLATNSTRPQIPYTFQVVNDDRVNAFATMGGFVYVNAGLLTTAANEAELASVLAHEVGHIADRDAVKQMKEAAIASGLVGAAGLNRNAAVAIGVDLALRRPNSRQDELQADELGLTMMGRTGYAQSAAVTFMTKLLRQSSVPAFLSTHPATSDRIRRMQALIDTKPANQGGGLDTAAYRTRISALL
jgi:predicted Zn-dependent protease